MQGILSDIWATMNTVRFYSSSLCFLIKTLNSQFPFSSVHFYIPSPVQILHSNLPLFGSHGLSFFRIPFTLPTSTLTYLSRHKMNATFSVRCVYTLTITHTHTCAEQIHVQFKAKVPMWRSEDNFGVSVSACNLAQKC